MRVTKIICNCCGCEIGEPFVIVFTGYYYMGKKVQSDYCYDCSLVILDAMKEAREKLQKNMNKESNENDRT